MRPSASVGHRLIFVCSAIILTVIAVFCAYGFAHLADAMEWDCGGGSCATNDPRSLTILGALLGTIAGCVLGAMAVGPIGPAITLAASAMAFSRGLDAAVADGYSNAATLGGPRVLAVICLVLAALLFIGWIPMFISNRRLAARVRRSRRARAVSAETDGATSPRA